MKFNFPNKEESVQIAVKIKIPLFEKIRDIAEAEECLRAEAIIVLLEGAVELYYEQKNPPKKTAYPVKPNSEKSIDEVPKKERKDRDNQTELTEEQKDYQKQYYQENKKELVEKKREKYRPSRSEEVKRNEAATKAEYYQNNPEKFHNPDKPKLPKEWWKEENLPHIPRDLGSRQPLPENFDGESAFCQYLMCNTKKYKRADGIEAQGRNFCSEKCYADWQQSAKQINLNN